MIKSNRGFEERYALLLLSKCICGDREKLNKSGDFDAEAFLFSRHSLMRHGMLAGAFQIES